MNKINNKKEFLSRAQDTLLNIIKDIENTPSINMKNLKKEDTTVVVVDMINGFAKAGALYSDRIEKMIPYISNLTQKFNGYRKIFFADTHTKESIEFESYVEHALLDSEESNIIEELTGYVTDNGMIVRKNSTNGFLSKDFTDFINGNPQYTNFVIVGDCTDICVMQFALTLKAYFNEWNIKSRVIIPLKGVETFDLDLTNHNGDLMNVFALYSMKTNGIELVSDLK